jgi:hypothetical protein
MFEYQGMQHLICAFENKSVQVFDLGTGYSLFEFQFGSANEVVSKVETQENVQ